MATPPSLPRAPQRSMASEEDDGPARGQLTARPHDENESEADETTSIMKRVRSSGKSYNTNVTAKTGAGASTDEASDERSSAAAQSSKPPRTRKQQAAPKRQEQDDRPAFWRRIVDKYGTIELENKASVARDHLALERTFLAWVRTSLSFASIGIAVSQLFRLNIGLDSDDGSPIHRVHHVGRPLGCTFLGIGIVTLLIGFHRYFESQHYVIMGKFPASRASIFLVTFVAAALIIASFAVILVVAPPTSGA